MKILDALRKRRSRGDAPSDEASSPGADELPISGYDHLDAKKIGARLAELSQIELAAVETYERSHRQRPEVLDKLRYMRTSEPVPGYDTLDSEGVAQVLAGADSQTIKAVRDYERKFQDRQAVRDEAARVLPASQASAGEKRAREQQTELVRDGFAGREKTAGGLESDRSAPDGQESGDDRSPDE